MEYSNLFVCLMGIGTVFFGLICIIVLTYAMSAVCKTKKTAAPAPAPAAAASAPAPVAAPAAAPAAPAALTPQAIAAVSAALAESLGTDISGIRITSIKKL